VLVPQSGDVSLANGQIESLHAATGHCTCTMQAVIKPMTPGTEISQLATTEEIKKRSADSKLTAPPEKPEQTVQPDEPIYQVFMPPLRYDAKTKVQADFDPNLIILVRRVRVRPTADLSGPRGRRPGCSPRCRSGRCSQISSDASSSPRNLHLDTCKNLFPQALVALDMTRLSSFLKSTGNS